MTTLYILAFAHAAEPRAQSFQSYLDCLGEVHERSHISQSDRSFFKPGVIAIPHRSIGPNNGCYYFFDSSKSYYFCLAADQGEADRLRSESASASARGAPTARYPVPYGSCGSGRCHYLMQLSDGTRVGIGVHDDTSLIGRQENPEGAGSATRARVTIWPWQPTKEFEKERTVKPIIPNEAYDEYVQALLDAEIKNQVSRYIRRLSERSKDPSEASRRLQEKCANIPSLQSFLKRIKAETELSAAASSSQIANSLLAK